VTKSQGSACTASPPPHLPAHSNHGHKEHTSSTPAAHSPPARPQRGHEQAPAGQQLLTVATEALAELQHVMDRSRDRQAPAARTQVRPTEELPASTGLLQQWDEQALLNSYYKPIHRWLQGELLPLLLQVCSSLRVQGELLCSQLAQARSTWSPPCGTRPCVMHRPLQTPANTSDGKQPLCCAGLFKSRNAPTKACGNTTTSPSAAPQQPLR
jgi:hypothetical protein